MSYIEIHTLMNFPKPSCFNSKLCKTLCSAAVNVPKGTQSLVGKLSLAYTAKSFGQDEKSSKFANSIYRKIYKIIRIL